MRTAEPRSLGSGRTPVVIRMTYHDEVNLKLCLES